MKPHVRFITILLFSLVISVLSSAQTAGERTSVDLTVYNMNLALIREIRPITLTKGLNTIVLPDIPATIDGTSLHFSSLTDPKSVRVLEQDFQYDLIHHAKLLEKYLGKEVEFVRYDQATEKEFSVFGKLLATGWQQQASYNPYGQRLPPSSYSYSGQMIAEINGKVEIGPSGRLDLTGWVTLTNNSGASFKDAGLKLVAGDLNVIKTEAEAVGFARKSLAMADEAAPQFEQKELFEYKLYTLQRRTDLANNETKQIELVSGRQIPSKKTFVYDGLSNFWRSWHNNAGYRAQRRFAQQSNTKMGVFVLFKNSQNEGLGIPLPKGKIRVYKRDSDGKEQFIGEDQGGHTPKDEEIRLYLGNAFDLTGSRVQKNFRVVVSGHSVEETFEIKVKNHKDEAVEVMVYEHPWRWSEWEITKSNAEWG